MLARAPEQPRCFSCRDQIGRVHVFILHLKHKKHNAYGTAPVPADLIASRVSASLRPDGSPPQQRVRWRRSPSCTAATESAPLDPWTSPLPACQHGPPVTQPHWPCLRDDDKFGETRLSKREQRHESARSQGHER
jgi:hypothetical protein